MQTKLKKLIASVIIFFLVTSGVLPILSTISFAEDETGNENTQNNNEQEIEEVGTEYEIKDEEEWDISEKQDGSVIARWRLADKSLTISGIGKMEDFDDNHKDYWKSPYKDAIESVIIDGDVENIGKNAFYECNSLKSIEILCNIKSIKESAFEKCGSLINIKVPDSVIDIERRAFLDVGYLILKQDSYAHEYAEKNKIPYLLEGKIENESKTIGTIYEIKQEDEWDMSKNQNGLIMAKWRLSDRTLIISGTGEMIDFTYTTTVFNTGSVSKSTLNYKEIGWKGKYNGIIENVIIEEGITSIGQWNFWKCSKLKEIIIPSSVKNIKYGAFKECRGLVNIIIPENVAEIGAYTFLGCISIAKLIIPNSVINIGIDALSDVKCIECKLDSYAFEYAEENNLKYIITTQTEIVDVENKIEEKKEWDISENQDNSIIATWTLQDKTLVISGKGKTKNLKDKDEWEKVYKKLVEKVIINDGVTRIGEFLFDGCKELQKIEMPYSLEEIGFFAFSGCNKLKYIEIPNSVINIEKYAFWECEGLNSIEIPEKVSFIGNGAFSGCDSLKEIKVSNDNTKYISISGVLYNKDRTQLIRYPQNKNEREYKIIGTVLSLTADAFAECKNLTYVEIPNSLTSIGHSAFYMCENIIGIEVPDSVKNIETNAFKGTGYIVCNKDSFTHKYAEENNIKYRLYPTIILTKDGTDIIQKRESVGIYVYLKEKTSQNIFRYVWSDKEDINKEEIINDFQNRQIIETPTNVEGNYYLYIYARSILNEEILFKSNAFRIDDIAPKLSIENNETEKTDKNVTVTIKSNEEVQEVSGWTLSEDKKLLTKEYTQNKKETIIVSDLAGNVTIANVNVNNIDKTGKTEEPEEPETDKLGDLNRSGKIDIGDILLLKRHIAQASSQEIANKHQNWELGDEQITIGDMNKNGKIDLGDILLLKRHIAASSSEEIAKKHPEWVINE